MNLIVIDSLSALTRTITTMANNFRNMRRQTWGELLNRAVECRGLLVSQPVWMLAIEVREWVTVEEMLEHIVCFYSKRIFWVKLFGNLSISSKTSTLSNECW
jgi:hypothetical protein